MKNAFFKIIAVSVILAACVPAKVPATDIPAPTETVPRPGPTVTLVPSPTFTPSMTPPAGLGISRPDGARKFEALEFRFVLKTDAYGKDVSIGTLPDRFAEVQLFGPESELTQAVLVVWVPQPPKKTQSARVTTYLTTMLATFAGDWDQGTDWLDAGLTKTGQSKTQFGFKEAILNQTPGKNLMTVELTIRLRSGK